MDEFLTTNIEEQAATSRLGSFAKVYKIHRGGSPRKWIYGAMAIMVLIMFLPWTQNIRARGIVTTLRQEERPQEINTLIAGRILKWYVKEGDFVHAGDTIVQLGEVKVEYFDTALLDRTQQQIVAKQQSIRGYKDKADASRTQAGALSIARTLKLQALGNKIIQQQSKVASDSADLIAVRNDLGIYSRQIEAARKMLDSGVISLVDFEKRRMNYQGAVAKRISAENKLLQGRQELNILELDRNGILQDYVEKISKAEGERFGSLSTAASSEGELAKLEGLLASYDARSQLYFLRAPQDGQVTKAKKAGIGEVLKEGEMAVEIVPTRANYAVEMFVEPMDLPLVNIGQKVTLVFDGFPAIVFSGWPGNSYGTFGGVVSAVENAVGNNGRFRVLVAEDSSVKKWPRQLRIGGGASGIALLKDVPVYYELWRNINGFPPEYYKPAGEDPDKKK